MKSMLALTSPARLQTEGLHRVAVVRRWLPSARSQPTLQFFEAVELCEWNGTALE